MKVASFGARPESFRGEGRAFPQSLAKPALGAAPYGDTLPTFVDAMVDLARILPMFSKVAA